MDRDSKTRPEHWQTILDFLEEHPTILKSKFNSYSNDNAENKKLWEALTNELNAMGLGSKTTEKWSLTISRWKNKTKGKAAALRKDHLVTGGGLPTTAPLSDMEERLMSLLGWRSVDGDGNKELGFDAVSFWTITMSPVIPMFC
ncbi:hypothetical protein NQ315_014715 [Exocentrus adspersus]|uniref:Regulatory protein zeste n=1 Tax=Exocentrus adspersus TaxID=1586481 RepID=A0AAV8VDY8_9CUCU|nr:hypothetical protein NQ315_014715 [Exocentrus adspersus]